MSEVMAEINKSVVLHELCVALWHYPVPTLVKAIGFNSGRIVLPIESAELVDALEYAERPHRITRIIGRGIGHDNAWRMVWPLEEGFDSSTSSPRPLSDRRPVFAEAVKYAIDLNGCLELQLLDRGFTSLVVEFAPLKTIESRGSCLGGFGDNIRFDWRSINHGKDTEFDLRDHPELRQSLLTLEGLSNDLSNGAISRS